MTERLHTEKPPYSSIADLYTSVNEVRPLNKFVGYPALFAAAGEVSGKDVLDLACGSGTVAREMRRRGARVVGVDESRKMLGIARVRNEKEKSGISYRYGRVGALGKIGDFDVITAGFLLHYAKTREELWRMCADIGANLKEDGIFVALNNNPLHPFASSEKYDNKVDVDLPLHEGSELRVLSKVGDITVPFTTYYWEKETYEKALNDAGLMNIEWIVPYPTPEGIKEIGEEYWKEFADKPLMMVVRAQKAVKNTA